MPILDAYMYQHSHFAVIPIQSLPISQSKSRNARSNPQNQKLIAIAGGTGTIGQSIVAALINHPTYKPIILSRAKPSNPDGTSTVTQQTIHPFGVSAPTETRYVDYASVPSLTTALQGINTLISTLLVPGPEFVPYQLNLLNAAIKSGVKRFAPSEFALSQVAHEYVDIDKAKITVWDAVQDAVSQKKIEAAAFPVGMLMNYLAIGVPDTEKREEGLAGFREGPLMFYLDQTPAVIEVPVTPDGAYPDICMTDICMTDIQDVGRFVVGALDLERWGGREMGIVGDRRNLGDVVGIVRARLKGRKDVVVREVTREELEERMQKLDEGDILGRMDLQYTMVCGQGGSVVEPVLNELCPDVNPTTIQEFMERYWA